MKCRNVKISKYRTIGISKRRWGKKKKHGLQRTRHNDDRRRQVHMVGGRDKAHDKTRHVDSRNSMVARRRQTAWLKTRQATRTPHDTHTDTKPGAIVRGHTWHSVATAGAKRLLMAGGRTTRTTGQPHASSSGAMVMIARGRQHAMARQQPTRIDTTTRVKYKGCTRDGGYT